MSTPLDFADVRKARKTEADVLEKSIESLFIRTGKHFLQDCFKAETVTRGFFDRMAIWSACRCGQRAASTH